jgi:AAHS family 4-hydroxybenzoate transporter-like MFS transporter
MTANEPFSILLAPCLAFGLPRSSDLKALPAAGAARLAAEDAGFFHSIGQLLDGEQRTKTLALWAFSFLIFADAYALMFWTPVLLIDFGYSINDAPFGVAVSSLGGVVANLLLITLVSRLLARHVLKIAALSAIVCIAGMALHASLPFPVGFAIAGAGGSLIACCVGQSALAVSLYPDWQRTNGVG